MTPFADMPKSTLCIQLLSFSALCSAWFSRVSSLWVQSFLAKEALLNLILWHWVTTGRMQLCLTPLHQMCQQKQKNVHLYCTPTSNFSLYSEALSTVHFSLKCSYMAYVPLRTMHCFSFVTRLTSHFVFSHQ